MGSAASYCHQAHGREPGSTIDSNSASWSRQAWRRDSSEPKAEMSSFGPRSNSRYCSKSKVAFVEFIAAGAGLNASGDRLLTKVFMSVCLNSAARRGHVSIGGGPQGEIGRDTSELQSHVNLVCRLLLE